MSKKIRLVVAVIFLMGVAACTQDRPKNIPDYLSVSQLQEAMKRGEFSSVELVTHLLARIEKIDRSGPKLNSIIEINPDVLAIAATLDDSAGQGEYAVRCTAYRLY